VARPQGAGWDIGAYEYVNIGIFNAEVRSAKYELKNHMPNPLCLADAVRLGVRVHDLQGRPMRPEHITASGIFLVGSAEKGFDKITIIK
jgi:hypothetical protein